MDLDAINIALGTDGTGCVMQWTAMFAAGENKNTASGYTDHPTCTHPAITNLAIRLNDSLPEDERQKLRHFIPRLMRAGQAQDETIAKRVSVRMAIWCARRVLHLCSEPVRPLAEEALEKAEAWLRGEATTGDLMDVRARLLQTRRAAVAYAAAYADAAAVAVAVAAAAADAVAVADAAAAAYAYAVAVADAAAAAYAYADASPSARLAYLDEMLDHYEKICADEGAYLDMSAYINNNKANGS